MNLVDLNSLPSNIEWLVGIDEVGRGPIAGPVTLGGVKCSRREYFSLSQELLAKDSKKMSSRQRESLCLEARQKVSLQMTTASSSAVYIDKYGISKAIKVALQKVLTQLQADPEETMVFLDGGLKAPDIFAYQATIIKGDTKEWLISMASVFAKVKRDNLMTAWSRQNRYLAYKWSKNKGYGTREHFNLIKKYGLSNQHRRSFLKKNLLF